MTHEKAVRSTSPALGLSTARGSSSVKLPRTMVSLAKDALVLFACFIVLQNTVGISSVGWLDKIFDKIRNGLPIKQEDTSPFNWKPCDPSNATSPYKCGSLTVPLDYTNASDPRTVTLAITLYQAGPKKSEKTLFRNPGGPGGSGTAVIWQNGEFLSLNLTGGMYDVLGWDPRGVNMSTPAISCYKSDAYRDRYALLRAEYPESAGPAAVHTADAFNQALAQGCREELGDLLRFMSTAFVARDMDEIRKALGEEVLNGYGMSYGTGIFQTYTQMFPERVGRMILDANEYAPDGRHPWGWGTTSLDNVTALFEDGFVGECVSAGPERCALASSTDLVNESTSPEEVLAARKALSGKIHSLFEGLKSRPISGSTPSQGPGIITYRMALDMLYQALYRPITWPMAAQLLADLMEGNATQALEQSNEFFYQYDPSKPTNGSGSLPIPEGWPHLQSSSVELDYAVVCGDGWDSEKKDLEWWIDLREEMVEKSWISGNWRFFESFFCRYFDWEVAEVYRGDFTASLNNPVLLISQTYDPATPLRNGLKLAHEMGYANARFVKHHGYGHGSQAQPSECTNAIRAAYWVNGTLPDRMVTECWADEKPYPPV